MRLALILLWIFWAVSPAVAADFYAGRTITLIIGTSAGGGYDLYARVLAKYLGHHIPGNPTIVPQNMTGAGSLRAMLYLADVAPKDGTTIATFSRSMPLAPVLGQPGARFDATKLTWLGSITKDTDTCISWQTSPIKTWSDLLEKPFKAGGEGKGADPDVGAAILKSVFDAPVKLITGYPGTADIALAMERGELDGLCGMSYSSIRSTHPDWLDKHLVNILVQGGVQPDPLLPGVAFEPAMGKTEAQAQVLQLLFAPQGMARPFAAPGGIPPDRAATLQAAFDATMKDPDFLADAHKLELDVDPLSGAEVAALLQRLYATPKDVVKQAASTIGY